MFRDMATSEVRATIAASRPTRRPKITNNIRFIVFAIIIIHLHARSFFIIKACYLILMRTTTTTIVSGKESPLTSTVSSFLLTRCSDFIVFTIGMMLENDIFALIFEADDLLPSSSISSSSSSSPSPYFCSCHHPLCHGELQFHGLCWFSFWLSGSVAHAIQRERDRETTTEIEIESKKRWILCKVYFFTKEVDTQIGRQSRREGERQRDYWWRGRVRDRLPLKGGSTVRRASVVRGGEAKNGSTPPTRVITCGGEKEREKETQK